MQCNRWLKPSVTINTKPSVTINTKPSVTTEIAQAFSPIYKGGFDVIIGNPPYGAELTKSEIKFLDDRFESSSSTKNSAIYFIQKAYKMINITGYISFIIPKSICYSSGWNEIANNIIPHLIKLIDTGEAFQEVLLEQVIFINSIQSNNESYLSGICLNNQININSKISKNIFYEYQVLPTGLTSFEFKIISKIINNSKIKYGNLVEIDRGLNWQSKSISDKLKTPIYRGAQLNRYFLKENTDFVNLDQFNEKDYIYQLKPKVLNQLAIAHVKNPYPHFYLQSFYDENDRFVFETISCTFPKNKDIELKFILCLNNSKLFAWLLYKFIYCNAIRSTRFDEKYVAKIPIPIIPDQLPFIALADIMLEKNKELQLCKNEFLNFLKAKFFSDGKGASSLVPENNNGACSIAQMQKFSTKLNNWYELTFNEFLLELNKAKVKIDLNEQFSWLTLFEKQKAVAMEIKSIIESTDKKIDSMVYELYGLTEEEIKIVEGE